MRYLFCAQTFEVIRKASLWIFCGKLWGGPEKIVDGVSLPTLADHLPAKQFTGLEELFQHHYGEGTTAE